MDGWHWAFSDSESEENEEDNSSKHVDKSWVLPGESESKETIAAGATKTKVRIAEKREEYLELQAEGLVLKPEGATLGVHPEAKVWRGSYPGSKHFGRCWGENRSPKKALLEILKLILEAHVAKQVKDKIAKAQLSRVTKAWEDTI